MEKEINNDELEMFELKYRNPRYKWDLEINDRKYTGDWKIYYHETEYGEITARLVTFINNTKDIEFFNKTFNIRLNRCDSVLWFSGVLISCQIDSETNFGELEFLIPFNWEDNSYEKTGDI